MTIIELREKRNKAWEAAKAFVETKRDNDGLLSAEDAASYAEMEQKIKDYGAEIERMEQMAAMDAQLSKPTSAPLTAKPLNGDKPKSGRASDEYKGVEVLAENNSQMKLYALGALELFDGIYDISAVSMAIFQPRRDNISEYAISKEELLRWANEVLAPTAQLAANGKGDFKAGEHCRFCKVRATCRKLAEYNLALARYDFEPPATLDNIEIAAILAKADELVSWVTDVKEYALRQALSGVSYDGFKVVEGRSNRKYTDENAVVEAVKSAGFDPYEHSVLGITAMTSLLGKKKFNELLGGLIEKPQGKPTLVPMSDKRPAINTANEDFKEDN